MAQITIFVTIIFPGMYNTKNGTKNITGQDF